MKGFAVIIFSSDILQSYIYILTVYNPADACSKNKKTTKFCKRCACSIVENWPRKNNVKRKVSSQERGLPWWASSDDFVHDFAYELLPE